MNKSSHTLKNYRPSQFHSDADDLRKNDDSRHDEKATKSERGNSAQAYYPDMDKRRELNSEIHEEEVR